MSLFVDIEKKLGSFHLHTSFEAQEGTMALLGASGCGKSVTLKCIAGIMTPDRGKIVLDGQTLFDSEARVNLTPQQRRVGYLFQQYALFPNMTVLQNIQCGIRTGSRAEKKAIAAGQARRFHLEGLEKKYPAQLSGGQQQRAALARILASEPRAVLLDEPFSALDSFLKWNLELELKDLLSGFPGSILWVSHDLGECYRNCQKVCVIENGVCAQMTDMKALVDRPATPGAARLTGCRNFLPARRCAGGVRLDGWDITLPLSAPQEIVTVAIPDGAVRLNALGQTANVLRVIRDISSTVVLLAPLKENAAPLRAALPDGISVSEGQTVTVSLDAERCICYG